MLALIHILPPLGFELDRRIRSRVRVDVSSLAPCPLPPRIISRPKIRTRVFVDHHERLWCELEIMQYDESSIYGALNTVSRSYGGCDEKDTSITAGVLKDGSFH